MATSNFEPEGPLMDLSKLRIFPPADFDAEQRERLRQKAATIRVQMADGSVEEYESGMEGR